MKNFKIDTMLFEVENVNNDLIMVYCNHGYACSSAMYDTKEKHFVYKDYKLTDRQEKILSNKLIKL